MIEPPMNELTNETKQVQSYIDGSTVEVFLDELRATVRVL